MSDMNARRMAAILIEQAAIFGSGKDLLSGDPKVVRKSATRMATVYKSAGVTPDEVIAEINSQLQEKGYV